MAEDPKPQLNISDSTLSSTLQNTRILGRNASRIKGNTLHSINNDGRYFRNAKPISRAEQGLKLSTSLGLLVGTKGVLEISDGPSINVTVEQAYHITPELKGVYTFRDENGKTYDMGFYDRHTTWDFYTFMKPVPFVPKTRKQRKQRNRKQRKSQRKCA